MDFFDRVWRHQPFHEPHNYLFADEMPPKHFEKTWQAATVLAKDKSFFRIDFYEVGNTVYFGENTFFPTSGMGGFEPKEWDKKFGELIPIKKHDRETHPLPY